MKKIILILFIVFSIQGFAKSFEVITSTGVLSSITGGIAGIVENGDNDIVVGVETGITPFFGEFVGGSVKLQTMTGVRYGIFYKDFRVYDGKWRDYFSTLGDSVESNQSDVDDSHYDIVGLTIAKVFSHDEFFSPFIELEGGYGTLRDKEKWVGEDGVEQVEYLDLRFGFAF